MEYCAWVDYLASMYYFKPRNGAIPSLHQKFEIFVVQWLVERIKDYLLLLGISPEKLNEKQKEKLRYLVHISFAMVLLTVIILFRAINDRAVIDKLFTIAGYTYGPLLGLFAFGLFTRYSVRDRLVPVIAVISPVICYLLSMFSEQLFSGYKFGFELLIVNGLITFAGLFIFRKTLKIKQV